MLILGGRFDLGPKLIASSLWLGIWISVGALIVFVTLVGRMDASRVGALLLLVPAVTAIASGPALGEAVHPLTLVGMLVAAAGVGTVLRRPTSAAPQPAAAGTNVAAGLEPTAAGAGAGPTAGGARAAAILQPTKADAGAPWRRQPEATRDRTPGATGAASGITKICPRQPPTSKVPVGLEPLIDVPTDQRRRTGPAVDAQLLDVSLTSLGDGVPHQRRADPMSRVTAGADQQIDVQLRAVGRRHVQWRDPDDQRRHRLTVPLGDAKPAGVDQPPDHGDPARATGERLRTPLLALTARHHPADRLVEQRHQPVRVVLIPTSNLEHHAQSISDRGIRAPTSTAAPRHRCW